MAKCSPFVLRREMGGKIPPKPLDEDGEVRNDILNYPRSPGRAVVQASSW